MAWENIEERLRKVFKVQISFPHGSIWLPDTHWTIDEWLTSTAETDEELRGLNIPRIRFLQNRWPVDRLVELRWDDLRNKRTIFAMNIGDTAYIMFFDGLDYHVIAAIEPRTNQSLYRALISKLLQNPSFVPTWPGSIKNYRPDLIGDIETAFEIPEVPEIHWAGAAPKAGEAKHGYLWQLLIGWVGNWINVPVVGYWHHEDQKKRTA